jgi:ferric iron reductase protein FhuF
VPARPSERQAPCDRVSKAEIRATLDEVAASGPFFPLREADGERECWRPAADLYRDDDELWNVVSAVATALRCEERVAASVFFLGYGARLLSPALTSVVLHGRLPDLRLEHLAWRPSAHESIEVGIHPVGGWAGSVPELLTHGLRFIIAEHLDPLGAALSGRARLARGILLGNTASAIVGALHSLRFRTGPGWRDLAALALASAGLEQSGRLQYADPVFVRRSCCLLYRAPGQVTCGDCPLRRQAARTGQ